MGIELASQRCEANALSTAFLEYIDNETCRIYIIHCLKKGSKRVFKAYRLYYFFVHVLLGLSHTLLTIIGGPL